MKTRIFTLFAAFMLLFGAKAMAQTNGDVNGDGKVDEQDITAIIQIMQEAGGVAEQTKYYWYAGQSQPTSLTSNPTPSVEFTCNNWFEIGTELPTSITQRVTGGVSGQGWYVALPSAANLRPTTSDKVTLDTSVKKAGTITVNNIQYDVWDLAGNTVTRLNPSFYK